MLEDIRVASSLLLALTFVVAGTGKLANPTATVGSLASVIPRLRDARRAVSVSVRGLGLVEVVTAAGLLFAHGFLATLLAWWTAGLLAMFLLYRVASARKGEPCGCLGAVAPAHAPGGWELAQGAMFLAAGLLLTLGSATEAPVAGITAWHAAGAGALFAGILAMGFVGAPSIEVGTRREAAVIAHVGLDGDAELDLSRRGFLRRMALATGAIFGLRQGGILGFPAAQGRDEASPTPGLEISSLPATRVAELLSNAQRTSQWAEIKRAVEASGLSVRPHEAWAGRVISRARGTEDWLYVPYLGRLAIGWTEGDPSLVHGPAAAAYLPTTNASGQPETLDALHVERTGVVPTRSRVDQAETVAVLQSFATSSRSAEPDCGAQFPCPCHPPNPVGCCIECLRDLTLACSLLCIFVPACLAGCGAGFLVGTQGCRCKCGGERAAGDPTCPDDPGVPAVSAWSLLGLAASVTLVGTAVSRLRGREAHSADTGPG